jgi:hypothetical protein
MTAHDMASTQNHAPVKKVRKAVLPAAGLGTRFLPATKAQPKEMLTVVDKPQIQYVVEECVASGIEHVIIVTGKGKNSIEDHFDSSPMLESFLESKGKNHQAEMVRDISNLVQVSYTRQKEPLGLGHAVLVARDLVGDEPFAVLLGDVLIPGENPATKQLIDVYRGSAQGSDTFVWDRGGRASAGAAVWSPDIAGHGSGGKAEARGCAFESGDYRAVCFACGDIRVFGADQTWGGWRDSVDRRIEVARAGARSLGLHLRGRVV